MEREPKLIVVTAPSGAGKTTLVKHLFNTRKDLAFSVSACTRERRNGEVDGVDYYFLSLEDFREKIKNGDFLEWEEVYKDTFYGTLKSEVDRLWKEKKNVIFDIDVQGAQNLKQQYGDKALTIFVLPPSHEVLVERLKYRQTENEDFLKKRIEKAKFELNFSDKFDVLIKNDLLHKAMEETEQAVEKFINKP